MVEQRKKPLLFQEAHLRYGPLEKLDGVNFHLQRIPRQRHDMWVDRDRGKEFDLIDSATLRFIRLDGTIVSIGLRGIEQGLDQEERFCLRTGSSYEIKGTDTTFRTHVIKWQGKGITPKITFQVDHSTGIRFITNKGREVVKKPR